MKKGKPLKRTPMKRTPCAMKRSPMKQKRSTPRTSKGLFADYKSEKKDLFDKKQSKTDEWTEVREELKEKFIAAGIISCELQLKNCTGAPNFGFTWSFAHSLKRNEISRDPERRFYEIREVVYACGTCHWAIEQVGNKERLDGQPKMKDIVREIRAKKPI